MWRNIISLWIAVAVVLVTGHTAVGQGDNQPPVARPDALSVDEGEHVSSHDDGVPSLLANDSDDLLPPDRLQVALVTGPAHGDLTLDADGAFTYQHDGSETTTDRFLYQVHDGVHASAPTTVTITIMPQNDAPTALPDGVTVGWGETVTVLDSGESSVLANDTDPDSARATLSVALVEGPAHGVLTLHADGTFVYVHGGENDLRDGFSYRVFDGEDVSAPVRVDVAVQPRRREVVRVFLPVGWAMVAK